MPCWIQNDGKVSFSASLSLFITLVVVAQRWTMPLRAFDWIDRNARKLIHKMPCAMCNYWIVCVCVLRLCWVSHLAFAVRLHWELVGFVRWKWRRAMKRRATPQWHMFVPVFDRWLHVFFVRLLRMAYGGGEAKRRRGIRQRIIGPENSFIF